MLYHGEVSKKSQASQALKSMIKWKPKTENLGLLSTWAMLIESITWCFSLLPININSDLKLSIIYSGLCIQVTSRLWSASIKSWHHRKSIRWRCLLVLDLSTTTTASLLQWHPSLHFAHWCPHSALEISIGINAFLHLILIWSTSISHLSPLRMKLEQSTSIVSALQT